MKNDELDKLVERGLSRLEYKAIKQQEKKQSEKLIFPSFSFIIGFILQVLILFALAGWFYFRGIKGILFSLGFWTLPFLVLFMMCTLVLNYDRNKANELLILIFVYMLFCFLAFPLYSKFLNFITDSGYTVIIPFFNFPLI